MELVKSVLFDVLNVGYLYRRLIRPLLTTETKLIIFVMCASVIALSFGVKTLELPYINTVFPLNTQDSSPVVLSESEKLNIQDLVANNMSYTYEKTQLGFYLEDLRFFESHSKAEVEEKILSNLPSYLAKKAKKYLRAVLILSEKHQIDPIWILSVMWTESNFDYSAKSWAGARGLMQIMPDTRKFIYTAHKKAGKKLVVEQEQFDVNKYFPYKVSQKQYTKHVKKLANIELGIIYLKKLLYSFKNHKYATVAYNMGPGWTRHRLKKNLPVGQKNLYLDKVRKAYKHISGHN